MWRSWLHCRDAYTPGLTRSAPSSFFRRRLTVSARRFYVALGAGAPRRACFFCVQSQISWAPRRRCSATGGPGRRIRVSAGPFPEVPPCLRVALAGVRVLFVPPKPPKPAARPNVKSGSPARDGDPRLSIPKPPLCTVSVSGENPHAQLRIATRQTPGRCLRTRRKRHCASLLS